MTPIYGRSPWHDPRANVVPPRATLSLLWHGRHDPPLVVVPPSGPILLCKSARRHDGTTARPRGAERKYVGKRLKNAVYLHISLSSRKTSCRPCQRSVCKISPAIYGGIGTMKMDITFYPNGKSNNGFEVGHIVNNMRVSWYKRNARLMEKIRPNATRCAHCGAEGGWLKGRGLQAHHIKPIWAWMLEQLLRQPPQDREEGAEMALRAQWGLTKFDTHFHTPDNLLCLCKQCHEKEESKTLKRWKAYFNEHPQVSIK